MRAPFFGSAASPMPWRTCASSSARWINPAPLIPIVLISNPGEIIRDAWPRAGALSS